MIKTRHQLGIYLLLLSLVGGSVLAHCEVPCGIYNDEMRLHLLAEHCQTIEKSMKSIVELSAEGDKNYNQIVRWINNKEHHANEIQEIVTQYFMTQRIKPAPEDDKVMQEKYARELGMLHQMLLLAMKAKQTTDTENVQKLNKLIHAFAQSYLGRDLSAHDHH